MLEVLRSGRLSLGPTIDRFEELVAERVGAPYAAAVSSGTAGLHLLCHIAGLGPGRRGDHLARLVRRLGQLLHLRGRDAGLRRRRSADAEPRSGRGRGGDHGADEGGRRRRHVRLPVRARRAARALRAPRARVDRGLGGGAGSRVQGHAARWTRAAGGVRLLSEQADRDGRRRCRRRRIPRSSGSCCAACATRAEPTTRAPGSDHVRLGWNYRWTDIQAAIGIAQLEKLDRILELRTAAAARYGELLGRASTASRRRSPTTPITPAPGSSTSSSSRRGSTAMLVMAELARRGSAPRSTSRASTCSQFIARAVRLSARHVPGRGGRMLPDAGAAVLHADRGRGPGTGGRDSFAPCSSGLRNRNKPYVESCRNGAKSRQIQANPMRRASAGLPDLGLPDSVRPRPRRSGGRCSSVRGRITVLAADGNRAAVTTQVKPGCGRVVVWTTPAQRVDPRQAGDPRLRRRRRHTARARRRPRRLDRAGRRQRPRDDGHGGQARAGSREAARVRDQRRPCRRRPHRRLGGAGCSEAARLLAYNSWTQTCDRRGDQECGQNDPLPSTSRTRSWCGSRTDAAWSSPAAPPPIRCSQRERQDGGRDGRRRVDSRRRTARRSRPFPTRLGPLARSRWARPAWRSRERSTLDLYNPATGAAVKSLPLGKRGVAPGSWTSTPGSRCCAARTASPWCASATAS